MIQTPNRRSRIMAKSNPWTIRTGEEGDVAANVTASIPSLIKLAELRKQIKALQEQERTIAAKAKRYFTATGATAGTAIGPDGNQVVVTTCRPTDTFDRARFASQHPDLATHYTVQVVRDELDIAALRADRPDLWDGFRTRQLRVNTAALQELAETTQGQPW
jgi:hypothetical protein